MIPSALSLYVQIDAYLLSTWKTGMRIWFLVCSQKCFLLWINVAGGGWNTSVEIVVPIFPFPRTVHHGLGYACLLRLSVCLFQAAAVAIELQVASSNDSCWGAGRTITLVVPTRLSLPSTTPLSVICVTQKVNGGI